MNAENKVRKYFPLLVLVSIALAAGMGVLVYSTSNGTVSEQPNQQQNTPKTTLPTSKTVRVGPLFSKPILIAGGVSVSVVILSVLVVISIIFYTNVDPKQQQALEAPPETVLETTPDQLPQEDKPEWYKTPLFTVIISYSLLCILYNIIRLFTAPTVCPWHSVLDMLVLGTFYLWNWLLSATLRKLLDRHDKMEEDPQSSRVHKVLVKVLIGAVLTAMITCVPIWIVGWVLMAVKSIFVACREGGQRVNEMWDEESDSQLFGTPPIGLFERIENLINGV